MGKKQKDADKPKIRPRIVNGWQIFSHGEFQSQLKKLIDAVKKLKKIHPKDWKEKTEAKVLAAILKLTLEDIPSDPTSVKFRLGNTLGDEYKNWFRAKFFEQFRLFFRYDTRSKVIIYGWVNDTGTLRAYGSKSDAYAIFKKKLQTKKPPNDWKVLLDEAQAMEKQQETLLEDAGDGAVR
jgi:toxin YhaV